MFYSRTCGRTAPEATLQQEHGPTKKPTACTQMVVSRGVRIPDRTFATPYLIREGFLVADKKVGLLAPVLAFLSPSPEHRVAAFA